jgi:tetrapyrrole methylase family protein/MazG family protein/ATP diphosphatase
MKKKTAALFDELRDIIHTLRGPEGCPWDRKQTPEDIKNYLTEELYEVFDAVDKNEKNILMEEIGDLIFMILFLVDLYEEKNAFTLTEILNTIKAKMIHRHPHVFSTTTVSSVEEVRINWQRLKEKEGKKPEESIFDGIPRNLPTLLRAFFLASKASEVGFDWQTPEDVLQKVTEEIKELEKAMTETDKEKSLEEIGDILFSMINISRHLGINPEQALYSANEKFQDRFKYIEMVLKKQGKDIKEATLAEMDSIWEEAKRLNR